MILKGNLESFHLENILQLLGNDRETGVLQLSDGENTVKIFLKDGVIIYATASRKEFRLGHFLRIKEIVPEEDLQKCLKSAREKNQQLGRILVEDGYISEEHLKMLLHQQVEEILCSLFLWKTGEFEYKDKPLEIDGKLFTEMNIMEVILEASRRIDEWSVITRDITSNGLIFKISADTQQQKEIKLDKGEWRLLSLIDGRRTVGEIVKMSGFDEYAAYKIIYSLIMSRLVERHGDAGEKSVDGVNYAAMVTVYNDVLQLIHKDLKNEVGQKAFDIFDECKSNLVPKQRDLLKNFDIGETIDANLETLLSALNVFKNTDEAQVLLIHTFNSLVQGILDKQGEILGKNLTKETINTIEKILFYLKKYHKSATEKMKAVYEIENVLSNVSQKIEAP